MRPKGIGKQFADSGFKLLSTLTNHGYRGFIWRELSDFLSATAAGKTKFIVRAGNNDVCYTLLALCNHIANGGGLGALAGKVFRVGLMGHGARIENVLRALAAFGDALAAAGHRPDVSAALAAVHCD